MQTIIRVKKTCTGDSWGQPQLPDKNSGQAVLFRVELFTYPKRQVIVGHHEYILEEDATVTCQIFNEEGEMVQEVFKDMAQRGGKIKFNFQLKALDLPKGKYVSRVLIEEKVFQEKWVEA